MRQILNKRSSIFNILVIMAVLIVGLLFIFSPSRSEARSMSYQEAVNNGDLTATPNLHLCQRYSYGKGFPFSLSAFDSYGVPYDVYDRGHVLNLQVMCANAQAYNFTVKGRGSDTYIWKNGYVTELTDEYRAYLLAMKQLKSNIWTRCHASGYADGKRIYTCTASPNFQVTCPRGLKRVTVSYSGGGGGGGNTRTISVLAPSCLFYGQKLQWRQISLAGNGKKANWWVGHARSTVNLNEPLYPAEDPVYFLSYVCTKQSGAWKCGCRDRSSCTANGLWSIQKVPSPANSAY